jgi:hypothetical protein
MAEVLKFDDVRHGTRSDGQWAAKSVPAHNRRNDTAAEEPFSFWPEVSCGLWVASAQPVDPANSPRRVGSEILLFLACAGLFVLLTSLFVQAPPV